jgi:predicted small secreted protein
MKIGRRVGVAALLAGCLLIAAGMGACNTAKGFGKDIEKAGDALQNAADRNGAD